MVWYHYLAGFFAGVFLTNTIPHLVHGVSGDKFPTPFAHPPGKGLSSPLVNVLWALLNLALGLLLVWVSQMTTTNFWSMAVCFGGVMVMSIRLSFALAGKHHE
jgi:hypothetical protein